MKFSKFLFFISMMTLLLAGCTPGLSIATKPVVSLSSRFAGTYLPTLGAYSSNSMTVTVSGGSECGTTFYENQPCVSVTLCSVTSPNICQTINNILLDTGSYGLRVFKSALSAATPNGSAVLSGLSPVKSGTDLLGECVTYGDGSSDWGQVVNAYVVLAGEPKVGVPIQLIDQTFQTPPSPCQAPNSVPDLVPTYFNGILGVGFMAQDCGNACVSSPDVGLYYTCKNGSCSSGATVELTAQVTNPVAALGIDGNGVILTLPVVPATGSVTVSGTLTLGIGGHTSAPGSGTVLQTNSTGEFITNTGVAFDSNSANWLMGFIDSGSNFNYFPVAVTACTGADTGFYCPGAGVALGASNLNYTNTNYLDNTKSSAIKLPIADFTYVTTNNPTSKVFSNLAGGSLTSMAGSFDYGLPFFFGKSVYVGITGTSSAPAGTFLNGPYFAYQNNVNMTISANQTDYNFATAFNTVGTGFSATLQAAGLWDGVSAANFVLTINSGVLIKASSTATFAFDTGANPLPVGSTLTILNNGQIYAAGGAAGDAVTANGKDGGSALKLRFPTIVNNLGSIGGGGGGGGAGQGATYFDTGTVCVNRSFLNVGGVGRGATVSSTAGTTSPNTGYLRSSLGGTSGCDPNYYTATANCMPITPVFIPGNGGDGGNFGQPGKPGTSASFNANVGYCTLGAAAGKGGAAGYSVDGVANLTSWTGNGAMGPMK